MSAGFWKRNEKVVMTLLLLVLAPAFGLTGIMTLVMSQGQQEGIEIYEIFGEKITVKELKIAQESLASQKVAGALRSVGPFGFPPWQRSIGAGERETLDYMIQLHQIDSLGLRPAGTQKQDALRDAALDVLTWYRVMEDRNWSAVPQDAYAAFTAERENAAFNPDEYRQALMSGKMGIKLTVENFEKAILETARGSLLNTAVGEIAVASEKEMYDEYSAQRKKASVDFVQVSSDRFMDEARGLIDETFLREVYDANSSQYRKSAAFTLTVAKADRGKFTDPDFQPTLEQITARFDADKATRYRVPRAPDWVAPEGHNPEVDDYRDLTIVFTQVEAAVKDSHAQEREKVVLGAAIQKAAELREAGTEFALVDLFSAEDQEKIIFDTLDWFTAADLNAMDFKYRNFAVLRGLFSDPSPDRIGEVSAEPVPVQNGDYIYMIAGVEGPRTESFEEAIAKVTTNAERQKAKELANAFLAEWSNKIRDEEETTFETFAANENYTVHSSPEPLDRNSGFKLKINDRQVVAGRNLMQQVFDESLEPGGVTTPVEFQFDDNLYLAKLTEVIPPTMDQWLAAKPGLEQAVLRRHQTSIIARYQARLDELSAPKDISPQRDPASGG